MSSPQFRIICTTLLVETSPQAIPLGAACVASAMKAKESLARQAEILLVDFSKEDEELSRKAETAATPDTVIARYIADALCQKKPSAVCFSVYVWNHTILDMAAGFVKQVLPDCHTIAGGPEVTADPRNFNNFDYTISGQGEVALPELMEELLVKADPSPVIPGVFSKNECRTSEEESFTPGRALPCPVETSSSPYLDGTIDPAKYGGALWELARGCPFKCSYCYESKGEKKIEYFPMERLEKELDLFALKKIPQVFVLDPTYNASKERALKILRLIKKKAPGIFFYFEARAEYIDRELARAFSEIPCCIQFGMQSSNPDVLQKVHRTIDQKKISRNVGFLNETGVTFGFDLIFGLPTDTFKGFRKSIDYALSLYPNNLELFCLSVLPGTTLHDQAAGYGMEWQKEPPYHVIRTPEFPEADLAKAEKLANATNLFYTQGRAVPWFNSVLFCLKEKPSDFLWDFALWLEKKDASTGGKTYSAGSAASTATGAAKEKKLSSMEITALQVEFVKQKLQKKHLDRLFPIAKDLINMHGALGLCTFDGTETRLTTSYHPDDVMSEYASDLQFFYQNAGKENCRVLVFDTPDGPDWKTVR